MQDIIFHEMLYICYTFWINVIIKVSDQSDAHWINKMVKKRLFGFSKILVSKNMYSLWIYILILYILSN